MIIPLSRRPLDEPGSRAAGGRVRGLAPSLPRGFLLMAALLVPWTLYLAVTLPRHYPAHHYWLGWVGFDLALVAVLAMTGVSLARGSAALPRYAATAATLLVVDAWFDVLNAATTADVLVAGLAAAFIELPLAYLCWLLARGGAGSPARDEDL